MRLLGQSYTQSDQAGRGPETVSSKSLCVHRDVVSSGKVLGRHSKKLNDDDDLESQQQQQPCSPREVGTIGTCVPSCRGVALSFSSYAGCGLQKFRKKNFGEGDLHHILLCSCWKNGPSVSFAQF